MVSCAGGETTPPSSVVDATAHSEAAAAPAEAGADATIANVDAPGKVDANVDFDAAVEGAARANLDAGVEAEAGVDLDAGVDADAVADVDAHIANASVVALTSGEGGFPCATTMIADSSPAYVHTDCDRSKQWCYTNHGFSFTGCLSLEPHCDVLDSGTTCMTPFYWDASACDGGYRRCECLTVTCGYGYCTDDEAGGVTVSCGACYGAPPARLERLARFAAVA